MTLPDPYALGPSTRPRHTWRRGRRAVVAVAVAAVLTTGSAYAQDAQEPPGADSRGEDKVEPTLQRQLAETETADFWIRFEDSADLSAASQAEEWAERGSRVADALQETAERSQADVRAELDAHGADYQAFWATNAIFVQDGSMELAEAMATHQEVEALYPAMTYDPPELKKGDEVRTLASVEWGIAAIKADEVWSQYDITGDNIVVANIDTGVQYDHPALAAQYRGNNGDGTFDHNYNWFDAYGSCGGAPCDRNGHGTHTMGTMAGDDGGTNQIGVAPGVTWIAANGCCTTSQGLIASAQWMLLPTDLAGKNPDAGKRPHIVNNSWGSELPSVDPFMEDVMMAWEASGIMGVWSNGNLGPTCRTSSSPGSRIINYSVGAYDAAGAIASFSSRGYGQDGETKPNIAAPGVGVRSAFPNDDYVSANGTSMAAPHVAGTIALLWSAAPGLVGDVGGTRQLLDGTATDAPDDRCGGSDDGGSDDNNVYGEGRLDALALLDAAPVGGTGTLDATITDAATGDPIAEATLTVAGPVSRERVTGGDGRYAMLLPPGEYTVTVTAFGYAPATTEITVVTGETVEHPVALEPLAMVDVEARVTDGSGQGWPLYAEVTVAGRPGGPIFTDPVDGRFSISLPAGKEQTITVDPYYDGYRTVTDDVTVTADDPTLGIEVPIQADGCPAEVGYEYAYDGLAEGFDDGQPDGWTVVDHLDVGNVWRFDDPNSRGNLTGGAGGFAAAESPGPPNGAIDTSLVTPVVDLSDHQSPILRFRQDFRRLFDIARVDLSLDGGETWENLLEQTTNTGPVEEIVPLPQAAGEPDVRVRFRLLEGRFLLRWWQLDDVFIGTRSCMPVSGSLMVGHTYDRNTGAVVNGATVTSDDESDDQTTVSATSETTPDDPGLEDGFYWMFTGLTRMHSFTATADLYQPHRQMARVRSGTITKRDFRLPAGQLVVEPEEITAQARTGQRGKQTITVTNTGTGPARIEFREGGDQHTIPRAGAAAEDDANGPVTNPAAGNPVLRVEGDFSPLALDSAPAAVDVPGDGAANSVPNRAEGAGSWVSLPDYPVPVYDNAVAEYDGKIYSVGGIHEAHTSRGFVFDPADGTWTEIAEMPEAREAPTAAFIDGLLYVHGGWGPDQRAKNSTFVYDPETDSWTTAADGPRGGAAGGHTVLDGKLYVVGGCTNNCNLNNVRRYDPATDTWESLAPYPEVVSHQACGAIDGLLYCAGGIRLGGVVWDRTYAYDPATDTWTRKADLPIQLWGMGYTVSSERLVVSGGITGGPTDIGQSDPPPTAITNEGFSYDPRTDTWSPIPPSNNLRYRGGSTCGLYRIGGGSSTTWTYDAEVLPTYGDCTTVDVPWMSLGDDAITIAPGKKAKLTVSYDAGGVEPGRHEARVWLWQDTPYLVYPVDVTLAVE